LLWRVFEDLAVARLDLRITTRMSIDRRTFMRRTAAGDDQTKQEE